MSLSHRVTLQLEFDLAAEPIEGEVREVTGRIHPFVGWLGLVTALECAAIDTPAGTDHHPEGDLHVP